MNFESMLGISPEAMLDLMLGMGMVGIIWMLLVTLALSVPPILVLISIRSRGSAKFGWFVVTSLFSWLGYVAFLIFTKPAPRSSGDDVAGSGYKRSG